MIRSLLKSIFRIAVMVFVSVEIIGMTCIDWFMFHPEMVRERYDASDEGYVDLGEKGETIAAVVLGPKRGKKAVLRCHGNAENMYESIGILRELTKRDIRAWRRSADGVRPVGSFQSRVPIIPTSPA